MDFRVEFPFYHEESNVTLEYDDGGLWVTVGNGDSYWVGPRTLKALSVAFKGEDER